MTTIGILSGTGSQGSGLGRRFARAEHEVVIGSRNPIAIDRRYQACPSMMITDLP